MKIIKNIILFLLIIVGLSFTLTNRHFVDVNIFPFDIQVSLPLFVVIILAVILGILISEIFNIFSYIKYKLKLRSLQKELNQIKNS